MRFADIWARHSDLVITLAALASFALFYFLVLRVFRLRKLHPLVNAGPQLVFLLWIFVGLVVFFVVALTHNLNLLLSNHTYRLIVIFTIYVVCIPVFGLLYFLLYRDNRANFAFASSIAQEHVRQARFDTERGLTDASQALPILAAALETIQTQGKACLTDAKSANGCDDKRLPEHLRHPGIYEQVDSLFFPDASYAACRRMTMPHAGVSTSLYVGMGEKVFGQYGFANEAPYGAEEFMAIYKESVIRCTAAIQQLSEKKASLESEYPDAWNYFDFFYFATITQTTVGYGDILPNSTIVRIFVSAQILLGYFIIAIMINFTFGHG